MEKLDTNTIIKLSKHDKSYHQILSSLLDVEINEVPYFIKQYSLFEILSRDCNDKYVNFFHDINIMNCELPDTHKAETFIKVLVLFITLMMKDKTHFLIKITDDYEERIYSSVLSQLPNANKYIYKYESLETKYVKFLNKTPRANDYVNSLSVYESNDIMIDDLNNYQISNYTIDIIIQYTKKYPNRIKKMNFYRLYHVEIDKLKILIEQNKESLETCIYEYIELFSECKNINSLLLTMRLPQSIPSNFDFTKITEIIERMDFNNSFNHLSKEGRNKTIIVEHIKLFNKCPNLEKLLIENNCVLHTYHLLPILMNINCPKLRVFHYSFEKKDCIDFDPIMERFPNLEEIQLNLEDDDYISYTHYSIYPLFSSGDISEIDFPNMVKLYDNHKKHEKFTQLLYILGTNKYLMEYLQYHPKLLSDIKGFNIYDFTHTNLSYQIEHLSQYCVQDLYSFFFMLNIKKIDYLVIFLKIQEVSNEILKEAIKLVKPFIIENKYEESYLPLLTDLFDEIDELQVIFDSEKKQFIMRD